MVGTIFSIIAVLKNLLAIFILWELVNSDINNYWQELLKKNNY